MAIYRERIEEAVCWGVWKMEESVEELLTLLPTGKSYEADLQRFTAPNRKREWLSVRVLLFRLLGTAVEIAYEPSGKPYLADRSHFISISHTKGYVAVMLSAVSEVGIDIEQYGPRIQKVAHKFMRDDEVAVAYNNDSTWSLLLHWSAKEVMFKCMNESEIDFKVHLQIDPFPIREQGELIAHEYRTAQQRCFRISYLLDPDFVLTWHA